MTVHSTFPFDLDGLLTLARTRREYLTQDDLDVLLDAIPVLIDHIVRTDPDRPSLIVCPGCHHPVRDMTAHLAFNHRRGL